MIQNPKMTLEALEKASHGTGGVYSLIAKKLGITRQTVAKYCKENEKAMMIIKNSKEEMLDVGETSLFKKVQDGEHWAIKYFLSCQGRDRGYVTRTEVDNKIFVTKEDEALLSELDD